MCDKVANRMQSLSSFVCLAASCSVNVTATIICTAVVFLLPMHGGTHHSPWITRVGLGGPGSLANRPKPSLASRVSKPTPRQRICTRQKQALPVKHFTSWLCLAPGNKISGSKILSSKTRRSSSTAAAALRLAATTIGKTDTALGAFYRRLAARIGKAKAVTATARKIAVLFYNTLCHGMDYVDSGATERPTDTDRSSWSPARRR